jgi:hypothetical protein
MPDREEYMYGERPVWIMVEEIPEPATACLTAAGIALAAVLGYKYRGAR